MESDKIKNFFEQVEDELLRQNMSIIEFAKRMGVCRSTVYNWLRGDVTPGIDRYFKAIEVLKISKKKLAKITTVK